MSGLAWLCQNRADWSLCIVLTPAVDGRYPEICSSLGAQFEHDKSQRDCNRVKSLWQILNRGIDFATNEYACWAHDE